MRIADRADEQIRHGKFRKAGVRFEIKPWNETEILWERCVPADSTSGVPEPENPGETPHHIRRTGEIVPIKTVDYGIFAPTERSDVPYAYLFDAAAENVGSNLITHGVLVEKLAHDTPLEVDQFVIADQKRAEHAFQGHHELTLTGK